MHRINEINLRLSVSKFSRFPLFYKRILLLLLFISLRGYLYDVHCSNDHPAIWRATQFRHEPSSCFYKNANVRRKDRFIFLACLLTFFLSPYSSCPILPQAESRCSLQNLIRTLGGCLHKSFSTLLMFTMNKTQLYFCHFSYLFKFICPVICVFICSAIITLSICYAIYHDTFQLTYF